MQNLPRYDGTRALVCGCYSGMGEATAQIVRSLGAEVVAVDVGWVMAFLNSPAASYVSGENVYTDGGAGNGMLTGAIKPPAVPGR